MWRKGEHVTISSLPPVGTTYKTGDTCQVSGVYACVDCQNAGRASVIPLSKGERFPPCAKTRTAVSWRLSQYA